MKEKISTEIASKRLIDSDNILIICHKNPDGDTIGSAGALHLALKSLDKVSAVICSDEIPNRYNYMQIEKYNNQFNPQFIVAVDVASTSLFGDAINDYTQKINLCIDHHSSNSFYADETFLNSDAGANCENMLEIIKKMKVEITPLMANCLYTGVVTDTGCFKFMNTTKETFLVAAELIDLGAEHNKLNTLLFESKSTNRLEIERIALQSLEYYFDNKCAMIAVTKEDINEAGVELADLEGITAIPKMIEGVQFGITIRQLQSGVYKVSIRTGAKHNASLIAKQLGGGGHAQAAGCEIMGSLQFVKTAILKEIEKALNEEIEE